MKQKSSGKRSVHHISFNYCVVADISAEALEAQIAKSNDTPPSQSDVPTRQSNLPPPNRNWSAGARYGEESGSKRSEQSAISAPSPTAFLEMLSSAASAQVPEPSSVPGLRNGASSSAMMTGTPLWSSQNDSSRNDGQQSSGLTPFLTFADSQAIDDAAAQKPSRDRQSTDPSSASSASRRASLNNPSPFGVNHISSPTGPTVLSPNNVFNFSPGPSGTIAPGQNINWAPPPGPDGKPQPSTRTEGPWRSVETVNTVFQSMDNGPAPPYEDTSKNDQSTDIDMDPGFPPVDEAMQQQLLMDLFWPGWPINLPEPHIVNEL